MIAVLIIVAVLIVVAAGAAMLSRRRAAEQARVEREREAIAEEAEKLEGRFQRATGAAERHGERAEDAQRRLDELSSRR